MRAHWIVIVWALSACSLLVDPESSDVRCVAQSGAADPCGELEAGQVCRDGTCQRCEPGAIAEDCNLFDDDCDGKIDEGSDQDGDGFTWCGGGVRELADCVDTDPTIRPAGDTLDGVPMHRDTCGDGIDNDCSGVPDDDPSCDGTADCEDADTACTATGSCVQCPSGQQCEPCPTGRNCGSRRTICIAPLNPGSSCSIDGDCLSGVCVDNATLGLSGGGGKVCSRACCTDLDCGADNVCVVRGNGTRLCAPTGLLSRGAKPQEQACSGNEECASGVCDPALQGGDAVCRRSCTDNADCSGSPHGQACVFETRGLIGGFVCGQGVEDGLGFGQVCVPNPPDRCASKLCVPSPIYLGACNQSCRSTCDAEVGSVCSYEAVNPLLPEFSRAPLCVRTDGSATLGQSCQESAECGQGRCVNNRCSQVCCNDSDCVGERCRPIDLGNGYGMYCAP